MFVHMFDSAAQRWALCQISAYRIGAPMGEIMQHINVGFFQSKRQLRLPGFVRLLILDGATGLRVMIRQRWTLHPATEDMKLDFCGNGNIHTMLILHHSWLDEL